MPVREGILWIPYDEVEKETGEILRTSDAALLDEDGCAQFCDDISRYTDELCAALKDCARICRNIGRGKYIEEIIDLGTFEMVSERMAVSDPCYDTDVWCRGELSNVLPGIWKASVVKRDEGDWGMRAAKLIAVHEDYADSVVELMELAPFEVGVDSGQAGLFDAQHSRDDAVVADPGTAVNGNDPGALWYMRCCHLTLTKLAAGVLPYGVVSSSGFGDGSYDCFYGRIETVDCHHEQSTGAQHYPLISQSTTVSPSTRENSRELLVTSVYPGIGHGRRSAYPARRCAAPGAPGRRRCLRNARRPASRNPVSECR